MTNLKQITDRNNESNELKGNYFQFKNDDLVYD